MLIRISLGMLAYVLVSLSFGKPFDLISLGLSLFFVLLPLADWLLYLPLRKRYKLVSHYVWYYPPIYVPVGAAIVYWVSGSGYYVVLFAVNSLANFVHATYRTPQGLKWIPRLSWKSVSLYGNKLRLFSEDERKAYLADLYEQLKERSLKRGHDDGMRTPSEEFSDRRKTHTKGPKTIAFLIISTLMLIFYYLRS